MMSLRLIASSVAICCVSLPAHAATPSEAPKADVGVAQDRLDADAVERLLGRFEDIRSNEGGRGEFSMDEILSFLPITDSERAHVVSAHSAPVPVTCSGDICTAVSHGSEVYQNLSELNNMPAYFGTTVTLKLHWRGTSTLEICSIKGFQVKQVFWVNVDGAYIEARGVDGSSYVDVGIGGSFPNC